MSDDDRHPTIQDVIQYLLDALTYFNAHLLREKEERADQWWPAGEDVSKRKTVH